MPRRTRVSIIVCLTAVLCCLLTAQTPQKKMPPEESLVRLVSADRAQQLTQFGSDYRIVQGNVKFLHNDTYLLCDSSAWNVDAKIIEAFGHVKLIQDETMLTSDEMVYLIDQNTARFSGPLVELTDKSGNRLRTRRLDYNTRDSTAVFERGAAMKDKDGNIIESLNGTYSSRTKNFTFINQVEVYMDSIFMKTHQLTYYSDTDRAVFGRDTYAWKDDNFVRSNDGYYSKKDSTLLFSDDVYINTKDYEAWADKAYYYRKTNVVEMLDNVRILDTAETMVFFANYATYERDSSRAFLTKDPSVIYYGENEDHVVDTLFTCADTMIFWTVPVCSFSDEEVVAAKKHREDALFDALLEFRTKQAAERAKMIEDGLRARGKLPPLPKDDSTATNPADSVDVPDISADSIPSPMDSLAAPADSLASPVDSLAAPADSLAAPADSLSAPRDSLAANIDSTATVALDSTAIKRLRAYHHVKAYRSDVQFCCDSMEFTELDSIAVLYGRPILWNNIKNQLTSETMHLLLKDGNLHRGSMLTDARITSKEDSLHFNQIKSTEMMGFFADNQLYRYDALGGVSAIFYMKDNDKLSNVNVKQSKSLTAMIKDGDAQRMLYIEEIKSDAYPLTEIEMDKQKLKGFEWRPEERPVDRYAVTSMQMPNSEREKYKNLTKPSYIYTNRYFDKYMSNVYKSIRDAERKRRKELAKQKRIKDSIAIADSLAMVAAVSPDSLALPDSSKVALADSLVVSKADSSDVRLKDVRNQPEVTDGKLSWKERRALRRAQRKARREARRAARRARHRIRNKEVQVLQQDS